MSSNNEMSRAGAGLDKWECYIQGEEWSAGWPIVRSQTTGKMICEPAGDGGAISTALAEQIADDHNVVSALTEEVRRLRAVLVAAKALAKSCTDVPGYSNERQYDENALDDLEAAISEVDAQGGQTQEKGK